MIEIKKLMLQLEAGEIKRYHARPIIGEQTVGSHTYGVVQILRVLMDGEPTVRLLLAALDHDVPEKITGDTPFTAKVSHPQLRQVLNHIEDTVFMEYGLQDCITKEEKILLKLADMLEMGFFAVRQMKLGNTSARAIVFPSWDREDPSQHQWNIT